MQASLFPDAIPDVPYTEGIKYAGSKLRLLPHILQLARKVHPHTIFDGFSGTTRISQAFARVKYRVVSNDVAVWSKVFALCYLKNKKLSAYYQGIIDYLNALPGKDGWFSEHYGGLANGGNSSQSDGLKKPWQIHNTRKLDAIRDEIDNLKLGEVETAVLLTSLILALDEVDNTLGHFASYLAAWSPRSYSTMKLKVPKFIDSPEDHEVYCDDIFNVLRHVRADLAYYDPPYGSNNEKMPPSRVRYAAYYHLWTTICLNDRPRLFGKVKRRLDSCDHVASSVFEEYRRNGGGAFIAVDAIERLLNETQSRFVILSYSSGGRATTEQLHNLLRKCGKIIECVKIDYRRNVMASMRWTHDWVREDESENQEYLFLIQKRP
jgi:adenine-specific DNA-methyltransferase